MANLLPDSRYGQRTSRREFLRAAGRLPLIAIVTVVGGVLVERRRERGVVCTQQFYCRGCRSLEACALPQATTYKKQNPS